MQLAAVLVVVGLLMGIPMVTYRYSRPRRAGELFGPVRAVLLTLSLIGLLLVLIGATVLLGA